MNWITNLRRHLRYFITITIGYLQYQYSKRFTVRKSRPNLLPVDDITVVSERITMVLAQNPGPFTLQGTNTYLVGNGDEKVLIDTGEPNKPMYIDKLRQALGSAKIVAIVCTHWHRDHIGGLDDVRAALNLSLENVPVYKLRRTDGKPEEPGFNLIDETTLTIASCNFRIVPTRGHTSDHMSVFLEEESVLFSGDCILGEGSSIFEDLSAYMDSLHRIKELQPKVICPGHGPLITKPTEKIDEYIHHRAKREKQIIEYLKTVDRANALEVTASLYSKLPKSVQIGAFGNIQQHLKKLVIDGKARMLGPIDYVLSH